jgi:hypothetical protein
MRWELNSSAFITSFLIKQSNNSALLISNYTFQYLNLRAFTILHDSRIYLNKF